MILKPPKFWQEKSLLSTSLLPCSWLYGLGSKFLHWLRTPIHCPCKVICIGNVTVGGAGKTPFAIYFARLILKNGGQIVFLSKGYGGKLKGPVCVNSNHNAEQVGDEAMMLSLVAPTVVAHNRVKSAFFAEKFHPDFMIMDDGLQNNSLFKDKSILVIDGFTGIGNNRILPAGPLRENLVAAANKTQAIIIIGEDKTGVRKLLPDNQLILQANVVLDTQIDLKGKKVIAFAGIGYPEKFFATLKNSDSIVIGSYSFADHHYYKPAELEHLIRLAERDDAILLTTEKDFVKINEPHRSKITAIKIKLELSSKDEQKLMELLEITPRL